MRRLCVELIVVVGGDGVAVNNALAAYWQCCLFVAACGIMLLWLKRFAGELWPGVTGILQITNLFTLS